MALQVSIKIEHGQIYLKHTWFRSSEFVARIPRPLQSGMIKAKLKSVILKADNEYKITQVKKTYIKNILFLALFLFVFLWFKLFCEEMKYVAKLGSESQVAKCLGCSELDLAKRNAREKEACC